jgi:hypothetical protein
MFKNKLKYSLFLFSFLFFFIKKKEIIVFSNTLLKYL